MKVSLNSIKKYTGEINQSVEEISEKIKESLAEVEHIENLNEKYKNIIVAEITEKKDHPNADKLGIYTINTGGETKQVVAGDKSLKKGDKVVYLPPNTKIPNNPYPSKFDGIIKKTKLRGIDSEGMLASEKELNLSSNHEQVLVLNIDCNVGDNFAEILELNDYILEIENKPLTIRPDTFGIIGLSREISAILKTNFKAPEWLNKCEEIKIKKEELPINVKNELDNLCPRYMAISMKNIKVKESPLWLKSLLASIDIKPINNIVDITNYLMVLTGQPLHAFDYDKVKAKDKKTKDGVLITIRTAKNNEKITTLDSKTVELNNKTVVICDSTNPIAIGGIMGGLDTEIEQKTKNIIIESANFNLYNIKKSSMNLGIFTEAVTRFSKGQDPNLCEPVLHQAIKMVKELAEGEIASNIQDEYSELPKETKLTFSIKYLNNHLGLNLKKEEIINILNRIELFEEKNNDDDLITLKIPTYRQDLKISEDIHEEVARLYGYKNIKITLPKRDLKPPKVNKSLILNKSIREIFKSMGCSEVLTYNFVSAKLYENCQLNLEHNYFLTNALSPELKFMRTTLLPSLIDKVNNNINRGYDEFGIYEINKTHNKLDFDEREGLPIEHNTLSFVFTNNEKTPYYNTKFFFDNLSKCLKTKDIKYENLNKISKDNLPNKIKIKIPMFDINRTAILTTSINQEKIYIGILGELNLITEEILKLKNKVGMFEIDLDELKKIINTKTEIINYSKFPKIQQDLCFVIDKDLPHDILIQSVNKALENKNLNYIVKTIDIYQKENETKQITINVTIQHKEKTLKEKDINSIRKLIEKKVFKDTKGEIKK